MTTSTFTVGDKTYHTASGTLEPYAFELGAKSLEATPLDDGDLLLEGWAARFNEVDREDEAFLNDSFDAGIDAFVSGTATLAYHHTKSLALGRVLSLERRREGLWMKARVDGAIRTHPVMGTYYQQIKNGTLSGVSVGGFFQRTRTPSGVRISAVDLTEVSITPSPVGGHKTRLAVVAGKALADGDPRVAGVLAQIEQLKLDIYRAQLRDLAQA